MPRTVQYPDPITTLRTRLRAAEQAASDVVLAVESLRAALRQAMAAVDDVPRERPTVSAPTLPPRPKRPPLTSVAPRFLRPKDVARICGLSRTTIWRMQRDGRFPARLRISTNAVRWLAEDVENWINTRELGG
jgi:predicted DNA-binding transcriptional regulator AlpA